MCFTAKLYITVVLALGAAALGRGLSVWDMHDPVRFACYLALAAGASGLKVRLPGITGTMSVSFVVLLAGVVELGLAPTLVMGGVCALVQSYWRPAVRPRVVQAAFSVANVMLAVTAAEFVYASTAVFGVETPYRLAAAAAAYFFANTYPVAMVIALVEGKPLRTVWASCYSWSFAYYLIGAAFVGMFGFADRLLDWRSWLLILPVVYITYRSYNVYLDRLAVEQRHAEEQKRHADQVAELHAQAMESLNSAVSANAKLDAVIQASPLAILAVDARGKVSTWNARAERMFGWEAAEVLGRPLPFNANGQKTGEEVPAIVETVGRTMAGEPVSALEATAVRRDRSAFEAAVWTAPLRGCAQDITGVLITVADVSDRSRLEEQLRISQKMEAVGRLAGGVAHDFNNLLTVINAYSAMLADNLGHDPHAQAQAKEIFSAGSRAASLVAQLLTFSRHQVNKPRPLDLNVLVMDIERMLSRLIGEHILLDTELHCDAGWILADYNQIETVLINLAANARDAMPDGGTLIIETGRADVLPGRPSPEPDLPSGSYSRLVVRDTGHGMDAHTQQHLFEPFFTTKEVGKGTGLGLSSVYAAVQKFGGRIFVKSHVGEGTAFSIYLPRCEQPNARPAERSGSREVSGGTESILLVEDEPAVRRIARDVLQRAGYRVSEAANGAEALAKYRDDLERFDLLVTDVVMPLMNGVRLAEELRQRRPELRIIFISGHAEDVLAGRAVDTVASHFLPKPFHPDMLAHKVRTVLDEAGQGRKTAAGGS